MNDNASLALGGNRSGLGGLPQRLVQDGVVEESAMLSALQAAKDRKSSFVTQLIAAGAAKARDIAIAASAEFGVPLYDLDSHHVDLDTVKLVQDKLLQKHRCLPLYRRGKRLFLARRRSHQPARHRRDQVPDRPGHRGGGRRRRQAAEAIDKAVEQADTAMPNLADDETGFDLENLDVTGGDDDVEGAGVSRDDIEDAPIVRFVNKLLLDAIRRGASDIHFEPYEKMYRIRLRMDGMLKEVAQPPVQLAMKLSARLKVMSRLDIAERRVPQDGRIKMKLSKTRAIDFRVSTCPTLFGEKIVCRILDPSQAMLGIDSLGYEPFQREIYLKNLAKPQGMILVTGPTGSGKTVSLYTGLNILNREDTNISTAEDPAEINLPGVNQVNVNNKVGLTFAARAARVPAPGSGRRHGRRNPRPRDGGNRHQGRADRPLGDVHAAHQRRAADAHASRRHGREALRHRDLGQPDHRAAPGAPAVLAVQGASSTFRPKRCSRKASRKPTCKAGIKIYGAKGCSACTDGYKGRCGIYQVMPVTEALGRIIMEGGNAIDIADQAAKEGVWDLRRAGLEKVRQGMTSLEEVNSVTIE